MEGENKKSARWSNHEEEVVRQYLKVNPDLPIKQAAKELAILIDRSPNAITIRIKRLKNEHDQILQYYEEMNPNKKHHNI